MEKLFQDGAEKKYSGAFKRVLVEGDREEIFYWSGVANTWFWIDPVDNIVAFAWTQSAYGNPPLNPMMRGLVYDALVTSNRSDAGDRP